MCDWIDKLRDKCSLFATPIIINKDNEYRNRLENIFQQLEETLIEVSADDSYIQEVRRYKEDLLFSVDQYYLGYISEAQDRIDRLMDGFDGNNLAISNINNSISFGTDQMEQEVQFFRARCHERTVDFSKKEMLHIPFSKRSIVKAGRFSIPGLPCLYLGTTSYVCWIELGRPADHMFNVSPVILDNTQKIFNLAVNFVDFCVAKSYSDVNRKTIFQLFLLSLATSFKVEEDHREFKSEYIISQLIMLSCMKKRLSGVTYYSKQVNNDFFAYSIGVNLALFAYYSHGNELSEICNHVSISDSFNYSMYQQLFAPLTYKKVDLRIDKIDRPQNIGTFDRHFLYRYTRFYEFDQYLYAYLAPKHPFNIEHDN